MDGADLVANNGTVFLGEEGSVKLGDFGLSKMIEAHDFASTYVGTPFYMSPEICAAEKYTLKSDIWSLGCIIYELCTREPPFNAKSHYQLIQKIKEGKFSPLPKIYSIELSSIIRDCLRTNPDHRPDTASLLNLPIVRLMRKEREVLDRNKAVKAREELLERKIAELEQRVLNADADRVNIRQEIDASLRREWEVKARLEIDRRVSIELEVLRKRFEDEVKVRVESELQMQKKTVAFVEPDAQELSSSTTKSDYPHSSIGAASAEEETSAITDITELSIDSPVEAPVSNGAAKKLNTRTPFGRAQTMFTNTPMDVEMGSPSPIAIASLALSPRRTAATKVPAANQPTIFGANGNGANNAHHEHLWHVHREPAGGDLDSDNDDGSIPSPRRLLFHTKAGSAKNPFTSRQRPVLHSQKTAPAAQAPTLGRLKSQPSLAAQAKSGASAAVSAMSSNPDFHTARSRDGSGGGGATTATATTNNNTGGGSRERAASPNRRLSKIPSAAALGDGALLLPPPLPQGGQPAQGLSRKPSLTGNGGNNRRGGLLEAAAAEGVSMHFTSKAAGGGIVLGAGASSSVAALTAGGAGGGGAAQGVKIAAQVRGRTLVELQQARAGGRGGGMMTAADLAGSPKRAFKERVMMAAAAQAAQGAENKEPPPVWDPDRDEMPSPFLVRKKPGVRQ